MSTNRSKDRASLCSFTFADGRQCRMPRREGHPYLCAFHARKEAQSLAGQGPPRILLIFSPVASYPLVTLVLLWAASFPRSLKVRSSPKPPPRSPTCPKRWCKPFTSRKTNTSTPSAPTIGERPSASLTTRTRIASRLANRSLPSQPRLPLQPNQLHPKKLQPTRL